MDLMLEILQRIAKRSVTVNTCEPFSEKQYTQWKADHMNSTNGNLNLEDGYDCQICKNKGYLVKVAEHADGSCSIVCADCKCAQTRKSILRMQRSGLKNVITDYTFDKFDATESWQKSMKQAAMEYAKEPKGWFFVGGQSGCGKSHICTAICREFLLAGKQVVYMLWRDDIAKLKSLAMDPGQRDSMIGQFKRAEVLYIDDLFKVGRSVDGSEPRPTAADISTAFEILNYRYCNPELLTIISTELSADDLMDIDEAVGGRIFERSRVINIARDRGKNYRLKGAVTL